VSRPRGLPKTGGRSAGAPNRATRDLKVFLQGVFREALIENPNARAALVAAIATGTLPPVLVKVYTAYAFGAPSREVDVRHQGHVSLAQLVSGSALAAIEAEEDAEDDEPGDVPAQDVR
jgi:hypothetical protein